MIVTTREDFRRTRELASLNNFGVLRNDFYKRNESVSITHCPVKVI